jgi:8-amino-7-oxononanoate synthase
LKSIPENIKALLQKRLSEGNLRKLEVNHPPIDFCSNDYLGYSKINLEEGDDANDKSGNGKSNLSGSTGSRLISGNSLQTEVLETEIAAFHSAEAALLFNSGYDANLGLLSSIAQKNDLIIYDELCHASLYDGMRLSFAKHYKFKHNQVENLKELLDRHHAGYLSVFVVVESIYSMDGDSAPLRQIAELCKAYDNCFLIVDEAHAIGVFGKDGRGLCNELSIEKDCFARIYTYGKALGAHGACVVGNKSLREYLINFARSFIYTTALPSHSVHAIRVGYQYLKVNKNRNQLSNIIDYFLESKKGINGFIESKSAIHSLVIGNKQVVDDFEKTLAEHKIYSKAIKSPTVKSGTERVRICLHAFNTKEEIDLLLSVIRENQRN